MKNILVVGANSAIARAVVRLYAYRQDKLYLVARNQEKLNQLANDLRVRGAPEVKTYCWDVNDRGGQQDILASSYRDSGGFDVVLVAHGTLPDQMLCEQDSDRLMQELETNALSIVRLLTDLVNQNKVSPSGVIAVISSVAGDRGRKSNYVYGAAKAMVSTYLQGLRGRLVKDGIRVVDIKPGFIDTPMTRDFDKGALWVEPEDVASAIIKAIDTSNRSVYIPWFWRFIMLIIKSIPEKIFIRLNL